jgi:hypothetical protein
VSDCPSRGVPSPFIPCPASRSRNGGFKTNKKTVKERTKSMFTNKAQANSPDRGVVKSTPATGAGIASPKPNRQETTCLSDANIATRAYEIWLSRGQETGNDQQHWFEARRQLQRA